MTRHQGSHRSNTMRATLFIALLFSSRVVTVLAHRPNTCVHNQLQQEHREAKTPHSVLESGIVLKANRSLTTGGWCGGKLVRNVALTNSLLSCANNALILVAAHALEVIDVEDVWVQVLQSPYLAAAMGGVTLMCGIISFRIASANENDFEQRSNAAIEAIRQKETVVDEGENNIVTAHTANLDVWISKNAFNRKVVAVVIPSLCWLNFFINTIFKAGRTDEELEKIVLGLKVKDVAASTLIFLMAVCVAYTSKTQTGKINRLIEALDKFSRGDGELPGLDEGMQRKVNQVLPIMLGGQKALPEPQEGDPEDPRKPLEGSVGIDKTLQVNVEGQCSQRELSF